jgi:hypothetical protein
MTISRGFLLATAALIILCIGFLWTNADAQTRCVVADPTGTPLNVRSQPQGTILGALNHALDLVSLKTAEAGLEFAVKV